MQCHYELTCSIHVILVTVGEAKGTDPPSALIPVKTNTPITTRHPPQIMNDDMNYDSGHLYLLVLPSPLFFSYISTFSLTSSPNSHHVWPVFHVLALSLGDTAGKVSFRQPETGNRAFMGESKSCTVLCCEFPFVPLRLDRENSSPLPQGREKRERRGETAGMKRDTGSSPVSIL